MTKKRKLKHTSRGLAGPDDPIYKEGVTFYTRPSDRASTPSKKTGKGIWKEAGPDDPIYKEGVTFYTRPSDRASTPLRIGSQVIFNPKRRPPAKPK